MEKLTDSSPAGLIARVVLCDQVKEFVIEAILSGEYKPGDRIVASALARQLGVSQAPVREAIRDLVLLGFLENEAFKGPSVRSFTAKDLWEIYAVRASLESLAAREASVRLTPDDSVKLRSILDNMILAAQNRDQMEMVRLDNEFHERIIKISGNQVLYQLWQNLRFGYWTIVTTRMLSYDLEDLARRHETLLKAVQSQDPQAAMDAMQHHIEDLGRPPQGLAPIG